MDSSENTPTHAQMSEEIIREQIEILYRYKERGTPLDPNFIGSHARMIVQLCDDLRRGPGSKPSTFGKGGLF